ncbi:hypothetical protein [Lactiplantibacillus paraxiangfangensis]|uniref:hypothetical protein n=1 Tax=Lactiplantibacillus paraxiangfangensis TaxID=3076224 RepID=UPI0030C7590F
MKPLAGVLNIFPMFAVKFDLMRIGPGPSDENSGGYFVGDDSEGNTADQKPLQTLTEPLMPFTSGRSVLMSLGAGGSADAFDYEWWSTGHYPTGTVVRYQGHELTVKKIDPYFEIGGFAVYYLSARSDHDGVSS